MNKYSLFAISVYLIYLGVLNIDAYIKASAKEKITQCGVVISNQRMQKSRVNFHLLVIAFPEKNIQFSLSQSLLKKLYLDTAEQTYQTLANIKEKAKVCITYSPKYFESTYLINGFQKDDFM